jgi:hypothetical protein
MKKIFSLCCSLAVCFSIFGQNSKNNIAGFSVGYGFKYENTVYIDFDEYSTWADHLGNATFGFFYENKLTPSFKIGTNFNYEKSKVDDYYLGESYAKKYMWGIHWIGQYPKSAFHGELGGFFKTGIIAHEEFGHNPKGMQYGIIAGPAVDFDRVSVAVHFQSGLSYFFQSESPTDVLVFYPEVLLKMGYCF